jgi:hypothetical protein
MDEGVDIFETAGNNRQSTAKRRDSAEDQPDPSSSSYRLTRLLPHPKQDPSRGTSYINASLYDMRYQGRRWV